jgi:hypothetical protein
MPHQPASPSSVQSVDDPRIKPNDILLRMVPPEHYPIDPSTGRRYVYSALFNTTRRGASVLRKGMAEAVIQQYFPECGIAEMIADEIRKAGCVIAIEEDPFFPHWPKDAHAVIYKQGQKQPKANLKDGQIDAPPPFKAAAALPAREIIPRQSMQRKGSIRKSQTSVQWKNNS